jgi:hypothetical protein
MLNPAQMGWLKSYNDGARYACKTLREKLYYIPEAWKTGNTDTLFSIVMSTLDEVEAHIKSAEEALKDGEI